MSARFFVDANVLVYARDSSDRSKQKLASEWMRELWRNQSGRVSIQALQEFYVTVTRKLSPGMNRRSARADVRDLLSWQPVPGDPELLAAAWKLEERYQLSWWDAAIVAAAERAECGYLLSEDFQDQAVFGELTVVNPFEHDHESVAG